MGHKKDNDMLRTLRQLDYLQWETAKELGREAPHLNPPETNRADRRRVKGMVKRAERALAAEGNRKARLHLNDGF
ncbi:hypothetical protein [Desulfovirgula thermocuniculi]|uniref:hypothetical protein n=1 Tax=Desulfovirgula thermocuniculi TaxID=348842 RepID=UPI0004029BFA|nr:hypothetical protein [Desulfovirgula thermocuniculi]